MLAYTGRVKNSFLEAFKQAVAFQAMGTRCESIQVRRGDCAEGRQDGCISPGERIRPRVERYVQTINRFTTALLHGQDILQVNHWNWALFHAIDCRNRVPNTKSRPTSPYEMITGRKTNLQKSFQFVFEKISSLFTCPMNETGSSICDGTSVSMLDNPSTPLKPRSPKTRISS